MKPALAAMLSSLLVALCATHGAQAQQAERLESILQRVPTAPPGIPLPPLPEGPLHYQTGEGMDIDVQVLGRGLSHPWGIAALPDGTLLVSERNKAQLRVLRDGVLDPNPVAGLPEVRAGGFTGLLDVVLHPDFANNHYIFLTYNKALGADAAAMAVLRGTWDGSALQDVRDVFVAPAGVSGASRVLFADGYLYMSIYGGSEDAQDLAQLRGKVLRLNEDGSVPADNPFANTAGARPEIFTYGHRTIQGLVRNPFTGEIWSLEMGPNGGDEVNVLKPGANYGWPHVSLGRDYAGPWQAADFRREGIENPVVYWMPSISVSGMTFYTGEALAAWQGDLLVGGLRMGEIPGTGQLQRVRFNANGEEIRREALLNDLHYRIRGAHQGPDGSVYLLVDEDDAAVLRIVPAK
jgi:glucose/arabinose dehydrogenase